MQVQYTPVSHLYTIFFSEADSTASAQEYFANEGYCAQTEDEVSFPKGSVVKVLKMCDSGWWRVRY